MSWDKWGPTIITLSAIPLTALFTALFTLWREHIIKNKEHDWNEDRFRETLKREDRIRKESQAREDALKVQQQAREDNIRREHLERQDKLMREQYLDWVSQQWWNRKNEAYAQIVDALWNIVDTDRQYGNDILGESTIAENELPILQKRSKEALLHLRKVSDIGSFVISKTAAESIERYIQVVERSSTNQNVYEVVELSYVSAQVCLEEVKQEAKKRLAA